MTNGLALALALLVLAATLAVAVARPPYLSDAVAASAGVVLLVIVGALGLSGARDALRDLGPTVGFLAAMLLIADGCRREGLFDAMGAVMARGSGGSPQRLLALVFVIAAAITAVLSLDATIAAVSVEWVVFRRFFAVDLERPRHAGARPARPELPRFAVAVLALTLAGFALSSVLGIEPVWFAAAGAAAMSIPALVRRAATPV